MTDAVNEAERTINYADKVAGRFARLLVGRLRVVDNDWVLKQLKTELRSYNAHTGRWKE
jgi:hypothetical protein